MTNRISYKLHLRHRPFFNLLIHYISKKGKELISAFILKDIFLRINKKLKKNDVMNRKPLLLTLYMNF